MVEELGSVCGAPVEDQRRHPHASGLGERANVREPLLLPACSHDRDDLIRAERRRPRFEVSQFGEGLVDNGCGTVGLVDQSKNVGDLEQPDESSLADRLLRGRDFGKRSVAAPRPARMHARVAWTSPRR